MRKNICEYRSIDFRMKTAGGESNDFYVEGYASTFEPYVLMTVDGIDYYERIEPTAFQNADMRDVVFRVDHQGAVYARTTAGTLKLWTDSHGLAQRTYLGKTQKARELYTEIAAGNYSKMSFAFSVAEDQYDKNTHTRIIKRIERVFDVSPVTFPANPQTELSVSTRDYFSNVIELERRERQKQRIRILASL